MTSSNVVGTEFGEWTVIDLVPFETGRTRRVVCECSCGVRRFVALNRLNAGVTRSCGHGAVRYSVGSNVHKIPEFWIWVQMNARCSNPKHRSFRNYGARGISVCEEWRGSGSFERFLSDMGNRPSPGHSLDRVDVNGGYSKDNCRWATATQQMRNTRLNRLLEINGESRCVAEWSEIYGIRPSVVYKRIENGWDAERALSTPPSRKYLSRSKRT